MDYFFLDAWDDDRYAQTDYDPDEHNWRTYDEEQDRINDEALDLYLDQQEQCQSI